jgi:hypothetical protein
MKNLVNSDLNKLTLKAPTKRVHRVLFDDDLPFKHRVERPKKTEYKRKSKHRNLETF